jgi:hypothetical protein
MEINETQERRSVPSGKKPYEKPSFRYEEVFVTTALSCGKLAGGGTQGPCGSATKAS